MHVRLDLVYCSSGALSRTVCVQRAGARTECCVEMDANTCLRAHAHLPHFYKTCLDADGGQRRTQCAGIRAYGMTTQLVLETQPASLLQGMYFDPETLFENKGDPTESGLLNNAAMRKALSIYSKVCGEHMGTGAVAYPLLKHTAMASSHPLQMIDVCRSCSRATSGVKHSELSIQRFGPRWKA